jgi:hypothetical protein
MINAIVVLILCLSAILIGFFFEWLARGRKRDLDLARMVATNDAVARAIVDRVNRDAERRAVEYREVRQ